VGYKEKYNTLPAMFIANIDNICHLDERLNTLLSFDIFLVVSIESLENWINFL